MRGNRIIMGTGVSLDIPTGKSQVFEEVFKLISDIDERFSTFKPDSELSKYQRGKITEKNLSNEMKMAIKACQKYEKLTNGYFSAYFADTFDPTGYIKGWSIAEAGILIEKSGYKTYCIAIGGDILARSEGSKEWNIGIQDPDYPQGILNKLTISNSAVATSGSYERGHHIIDPKTGRPADKLLSVTVTGPDIIPADVLATAIFARGKADKLVLEQFPGYEALAIPREVV